jgi:hypothetical protein
MLKVAGLVFVAVGAAAGVALVLAPFGSLGLAPTVGTWLLFPLGLLVGQILFALGSRIETAAVLSRVVGGFLLALSAFAAVCLLLPALGVAIRTGSAFPVWFVLVVAAIFGGAFLSGTGRHAQRV